LIDSGTGGKSGIEIEYALRAVNLRRLADIDLTHKLRQWAVKQLIDLAVIRRHGASTCQDPVIEKPSLIEGNRAYVITKRSGHGIAIARKSKLDHSGLLSHRK